MRVGACSQIPSHLTGIITLAKASSPEPCTTREQDRPPINLCLALSVSISLSPIAGRDGG